MSKLVDKNIQPVLIVAIVVQYKLNYFKVKLTQYFKARSRHLNIFHFQNVMLVSFIFCYGNPTIKSYVSFSSSCSQLHIHTRGQMVTLTVINYYKLYPVFSRRLLNVVPL